MISIGVSLSEMCWVNKKKLRVYSTWRTSVLIVPSSVFCMGFPATMLRTRDIYSAAFDLLRRRLCGTQLAWLTHSGPSIYIIRALQHAQVLYAALYIILFGWLDAFACNLVPKLFPRSHFPQKLFLFSTSQLIKSNYMILSDGWSALHTRLNSDRFFFELRAAL